MSDDPRTFLDRARSLLDGSLDPGEADALRREISADPALRAEVDALRDVLALTAAAGDAPSARVTAEDVLSRARPVLRLRPWAAAAAALLVAAAGIAAVTMRHRTADVTLAGLRSGPPFPAAARAEPVTAPFPGALAEYEPVTPTSPNWITDLAAGRAMSQETGRPMLVWVNFEGCPLCVQLDRETFTDAAVLADVAAFVPVKVDVQSLEPASDLARQVAKGFQSGKWPFIVTIGADGTSLREITGVWEKDDVAPALGAAAAEAARMGARIGAPTWPQVRAAAAEIRRAEAARDGDRLGEALSALGRAAETLGPAAVPGTAPRIVQRVHGGFALPLDPQVVLEDAVRAADPASALPALDAAARRFAGSTAGDDLAAVARAIRDTGRFPRLHAPTETRP